MSQPLPAKTAGAASARILQYDNSPSDPFARRNRYRVMRCLHIPVFPHLGHVSLRFAKV